MTDDESLLPPTLLSELAPTDPEEIKAMRDRRVECKHYAAIGRIAASWSYFEAIVDGATLKFGEIDIPIGICLTAQIVGPTRKLDAFIALARYKGISKRLLEDLLAFAKDARGLGEQRNRTIHDVWYFTPNSPHRVEATATKVLRLLHIPVTTEELLRLDQNIRALQDRFAALLARVHSELPPSPETRPSGMAS